MNLPALVNQPSAFTFAIGDRVMQTYPLALLARIGQTDKVGTVTHVFENWVSVDWDNATHSMNNPAYLRKA
jgi:hypothetical protein